MMDIWDWFDPHDIKHIRAYAHLSEEGVWPEGFIPEEGVVLRPGWQLIIASRMADAWVDYMLDQHGE